MPNFCLDQQAFIPFEAIVIDEQRLHRTLYDLYQRQDPSHQYDAAAGARSRYMVQLNWLIDELFSLVLRKPGFDTQEFRDQIALFKVSLSNVAYVSPNADVQRSYYESYKINLETIYYLIQNWGFDKKHAFILELGHKISVCAAGAHTQLTNTVYELTTKPSINSWLSEMRKNIVHRFADEFTLRHGINDALSIHVHSCCLDHARQMGWNIPADQHIRGFHDQYRPREITEQTAIEFNTYFYANYTATAIIDNVVLNYQALLASYFNRNHLTQDESNSIMAILQPFEGIVDIGDDVLDYSDDQGLFIRPAFQANLPRYVAKLLEQNSIIQPDLKFLKRSILGAMSDEINRLSGKYDANNVRVVYLQESYADINGIFNSAEPHKLTRISTYIKDAYINNNPLDKYSSWGEKFGLVLLNILFVLPCAIPLAIKYAVTGTFFFSQSGKTQDLMEDAYEQVLGASQ